jgi:hypothetical protein
MKAKRPNNPDPEVDKIVEDLSQQDVLPVDGGSPATPDSIEMNAEDGAGRWSEPPGATGHRAARLPLEDETKAAEELVERGSNEAADELQELEEDEGPEEAA